MEEIPNWVIEYDKANHQSSAGKAVRILMNRIQELESGSTTNRDSYARDVWNRACEAQKAKFIERLKHVYDPYTLSQVPIPELTGASSNNINQTVYLYFHECGKIGPCVISELKYTDYGKVLYSVKMRPFASEPDNAELTTQLIDVDSYFVKSEAEMILEGLA